MLDTWFRGLLGRASARLRRRPAKKPARPTVRPRLEALEDRTVPAAIRDFAEFRANIMLPTFAFVPPVPTIPPFLGKVHDTSVSQGGFTDDGSTATSVPLDFFINFFGTRTNRVFVNNNGNISIGAPIPNTPGDFNIETGGIPIIAPFFADVDTRRLGSQPVSYGQGILAGHRAFGVDWIHVPYFHGNPAPALDKFDSIQLILIDRSDTGPGNFDIEFNYDTIQWETGDADGGQNGLGGRSALAGASVGFAVGDDQIRHTFLLQGSGSPGSFIDGGPFALASNSLHALTPGRYHFLFRNGELVGALPPIGVSFTPLVRQFNPFRYVAHRGTLTGRFLFIRESNAFFEAFNNTDIALDEVGFQQIISSGAPITLVFKHLPRGVTLVNPSGFTASGAPFLTLTNESLLSVGSRFRVTLSFRNPHHVPLSTFYRGFLIDVFAGPFDPASV